MKPASSGNTTMMAAAIVKVHSGVLSVAWVSMARPTVSVRALTVSVTMSGQKNSFQ